MEKRQNRIMETIGRKPLQGVTNIIRFNWHFYVIAFVFISFLLIALNYLPQQFHLISIILVFLIVFSITISLAVSYYIYDYSNLYTLDWLQNIHSNSFTNIANINAGFDETSALLANHFPNAILNVYDFYDKNKHTEMSIERARKTYPPHHNTLQIDTKNVSVNSNHFGAIFLILAAHEIRNEAERINFFKQLKESISNDGKIIVVEHQRDIMNFLAFNIGFLHFYSQSNWLNTFKKAELQLSSNFKITPFISTFILSKNGNTP